MYIQKLFGKLSIKLIIVSLLFFMISVVFNPKSVSASSKTFEPTRDTYVDSSLPNSSFGNIGLGVVKHQPSDSSSSLALFHFDVSSIPVGSVVSSAILKIRLGGCINSSDSAGHIGLASYVTNGSPAWTENSTYAQLSTSGSSIDGFATQLISCSNGAYYDLDLAPIVNFWIENPSINDGLILNRISGGDYWTRVFYMSEASESSRPKLTINYEVPYESVPTPDGVPTLEGSTPVEDAKKKSDDNTVVAESTPESVAPDESIQPASKLTAKQIKGKSDVLLKWDASKTKDINGYRIYRKIAGEKTYKKIADLDKSKIEFLDTKAKVNLQHSYFVRVVRGDRESRNSPTASIVIQPKTNTKSSVQIENQNKNLWMLIYIMFMLLVSSLLAYSLLHKKHKDLHTKHKKVIDKK